MDNNVPSLPPLSSNSSLSLIRDEDIMRRPSDEQRPNESLLEYWTRREKEAAQRALRHDYLQQRSKRKAQSKIVLPEEVSIPDNDASASSSASNASGEESDKQRSGITYSLPQEAIAMHDFIFRHVDETTTIDENLTASSFDEDKEMSNWTKRAVKDAARVTIIRNKESNEVSQFSSDDDESEIDFDADDQPDEPNFFNLHADLEKCSWSLLDQHLVCLSKRPDLILRTMLQIDQSHGNATPLHTACWKAPPLLALHMISLLPRIDQHMEHICLVQDADGNTALHLCAANICQDFQHNRMAMNTNNRYHRPDNSRAYDEEDVEYDQLDFQSIPGFRGEDVIEALVLSAPMALTIQNNEGDTPLHLAVSSSFSTSHAVSILAKGASSKACFLQDCTGACPLHAATANNVNESVLTVLLEVAPDVAQIADKQGLLPLHYVAAFCHTPIAFVQRLIEVYPDAIFGQTIDGDTPLHLAISNCKSEDELTISTVELLLGNYAVADSRNPVFIANNEKLIPLACCAVFDAPERVKEILVQHCIDHNGSNDEATVLTFRQTAKLSSTVAAAASPKENETYTVDAKGDKEQIDATAVNSLSMLSSNSYAAHEKGKVTESDRREICKEMQNADNRRRKSSDASFYLSGIANMQPPQSTVDRVECLSKLFSYRGPASLAKEKLPSRMLNSQVNSLAKSLALPIFVSKG